MKFVGTAVGMTDERNRRKASITVKEVEALAKRPGRHSIGSGLILVVRESGAASWIARVRSPDGRRKDIGLGRFPEVSLKEASTKAAEHRKVSRDGVDPVARKRELKRVMPTFEKAAETVFAERENGFRNKKHGAQWIGTLREFVIPAIGSMPVDQVDGPTVVRVLKPIWLKVPETARRVLQRVATVIAWAAAHGYRDHELPVRAIRMGLPPQPAKKPKHHAAVSVEAASEAFQKLTGGEGVARDCLRFIILTAARSNEARGAKWSEIDFESKTWTVPPERMKAGEEHIVPLSEPAIALLRSLPRIAPNEDFLFPGIRRGRSIVDAAVSKSMRIALPTGTVHGWRSTFRDWAAERTSFPGEVAEAALAHTVRNKVEAAYRRTKYLEQRRTLMTRWAEFLAGDEGKVVQLRAG